MQVPDAHNVDSVVFGRERELETLHRSVERSCAGTGELVLVSGEAGIGKTTLVRAAGDYARSCGAGIHRSACYDLSVTPPYKPWIELFDSIGYPISPPAELTGDYPLEWASNQDQLFTDALDLLRTASSEKPRMLVLEDLHWTDAATLEFLRYAARQVHDIPATIVVTYRDTDIDRQHPFYLHLPNLVRESDATRISLRPLDQDSINAILQQRYGFAQSDLKRMVNYLIERTEGNPFFIDEILRELEDNGVIYQERDQWQVGDPGRTPVPTLVRQVIDGRLSHLSQDARSTLAVAAAIGEDVPLKIWQDAGGLDEAQLDEAIRAAMRFNLLDESNDPGSVHFTHSLIREALYHEVSVPQRRSLHRAIGEARASCMPDNPDAIAWHFQQAQDERAAEWLTRAGERAQYLYAWRTAAERFSAVYDLLAGNLQMGQVRGWVAYRTGLLLTYADSEASIHWMQDAEYLAASNGDDRLAAYARADRGLLRCLTGDVRRGLEELRSGVDAIDALEPLADDAQTAGGPVSVEAIRTGTFQLVSTTDTVNVRRGPLVLWLAWAGRLGEALETGEQFLDQAAGVSGNLHDAVGDCYAGMGHALAALGRPDDALDSFNRARETYGRIDHHFKVGNTAIYELSEAFLPYRAERIMEREWLADQAEAY